MHASREDMPVSFVAEGFESRIAEWGDLTASFDSLPAGTDTTGLFDGLPDGRCQCRHWGFVFKGKFRISYHGREETVTAGEAYYAAPGHHKLFLEDTELVEFSDTEERQRTLEVVERNLKARDA